MPRVWFITGCSRGLGLALCKLVLDAGESVAATARWSESLQHLLDHYGPERVLTLDLDVNDPSQATEAAQAAKDKFGSIDVLVNNAGYAEVTAIEDSTVQNFQDQMNTNFFGVVWVTKAVLPIMREQRSGRILQISSVGGRIGGSPGLGAYQSAKFAVAGFSTVLAAETKPFNIHITTCEPGGIRTEWSSRSSETRGPISEPYRQILEGFESYKKELSSSWTLPEDIARGIWKISLVDDPPARLLLGKDTPPYAKMISESTAMSDDKWMEITIGSGDPSS